MHYEVALGGVKFDLPSLPWRLVRELQPALLSWAAKHDFSSGVGAAQLASEDLEELASFVFKAVAHSPQGRTMTKEQFDELPIGTLEMAQAVPPILRACGLKLVKPGEGAGDPKA